jgi:hypothetical protein
LEKSLGSGLGVEDVGGGKPGSAELGDPVAHLVEFFGGVSVRIHDNFAAVLFGETEMEIVQVGARGAGVVFDGYS